MNLPGLGLDDADDGETPDVGLGQVKVDTHDIRERGEWRFEVAVGKAVVVKVSRTSSLLGESENQY